MSGADPFDELEAALNVYRRKYGTRPGVWSFLGEQERLASLIREAVTRGKRLTDAEMHRRMGMEEPPKDVEL